ncbi:MAG TPA: hypothetical protein ENK02_12585 [Planctomycetes bacterium]|nr:hypothetical protein [Planctomycetota bacterium]
MSPDTNKAETTYTSILVDGKEYQAPLGGRLIDFLHSIGKEIPHFCYHQGLPVAASCRQCQIESKGKGPRPGLAVSCRETIIEGMEILTDSELVRKARAGVMEFLLINHPLDCPICDKAGECMLQDTAYATGQDRGRTHEPRRHLDKRKSLGDKILLDNERCILCTRCVRFFEAVTKEPQLTVLDRGDRSYLSTFMGDPLHGNYQGNIVDLCPVGALTLKKFRFKSRVWFLHSTETVCGLCSRGCNISVETRDNKILRIRPRHNPNINDFWMCDEGRLEFDRYNLEVTETRLPSPFYRDSQGHQVPTNLQEALDQAAPLLLRNPKVLFVLSPFATIEEGWAFKEMVETLERFGLEPEMGYYQPDPNAKGDEFLHTDEPAPNCKGLREEVGLKAIPPESLEGQDPTRLALIGFGFGELLGRACLETIAAQGPLLHLGIRSDLFPNALVRLAGWSPMEKAGHWIAACGTKQYLRPALRPPALSGDDFQLLTRLQERILTWDEEQFEIQDKEELGNQTQGTEEVRT